MPPEYWRGLASSLHFPGKTSKACLRAPHTDIVTVWNFCDTSEVPRIEFLHSFAPLTRVAQLLPLEEFQARMSQLVSDLVDDKAGNPNKLACVTT